MSPSKKPPKPRRTRGSHVMRRHAEPPPPQEPPPPPAAPEPDPRGATVPVMVGGIRIADLILAPAANLPTGRDISSTLSWLHDWLAIGAELAAMGSIHIALGGAVARRHESLLQYLEPEQDPSRGGES